MPQGRPRAPISPKMKFTSPPSRPTNSLGSLRFSVGRSAMANWWTILSPMWRRMSKDNVSALAAGAAFQALFTIFPALTAAVSLYGLVADPNMVERQIMAVQGVLPPEAIALIAAW